MICFKTEGIGLLKDCFKKNKNGNSINIRYNEKHKREKTKDYNYCI